MLRYWRKGRETDHLVWEKRMEKTLCGIKTYDSIRMLPFDPSMTGVYSEHNPLCRKCFSAYRDR